MSKTPQNMPPSPSPSSIFMPLGRQSRRGSLTSLSSNSQVDREALSQALDHIHTSASRSDTLTTFNEFTSPPSSSSTIDGKGLAGDFVHGGLSGLYSRFRGAVGGKRDKPSSPSSPVESADTDASSRRSSRMADSIPQSEPSRSAKSGVPSSAASSRSSTAQTDTPKPVDAADGRSSRKPRSAASTAPLRGQSTNPTSQNAPKALSAPFVRATPSSVADPTLAPVNVVAYKDNGRASADHSRKNSATANPKPSPEQMHPAQRPDKSRGTSDHSTKSAITSNTLPIESHSAAATTVPSDRLMEEIEQRLPGDAKQDDVLSTQKDTIPFPKIVAPPSQSAVPGAALGLSIKSQAHVPEPVNVRKAPTKSRDRDRDPHGDLNVKSTPSIKPGTTNGDDQLSLLQKSQHRGLGEGPYIDGPESPGKAVADDVSPNALTHGSDAANHPSSSDSDDTTRLDNISIEPANARQQRMAKEQGSSHERTSSQGQMASDGDREVVNTALQQIKSRILSKDFWMRDENCKECFDCGTAFSTWRRKHHCRICGQIFDAKCTSLVSGRRFGQLGSLRVCKRCMEIINESQDDTDDVESDDDEPLSTSLFHSQSHQARQDLIRGSQAQDIDDEGHGLRRTSHADDLRPLATPMMAIPATRRAGDSHRRSAVLEIDADDINIRPASSRPAKTSSVGRSSTNNHRRHRSRQQLSRSFRTVHEEKAPFHRSPADDGSKGMRLPAFHNDSIIDPDLAPYMSDEGSSGDETAGIFSTMNDDPASAEPGDNDKGGLGGLLALAKGAKRARSKGLEKSGSVGSFGSRDVDDGSMTSLKAGISRRLSRKRTGTDGFPSPGSISHGLSPPKASGSRMTRSASMKGAIAPAVELNNASLQHVRNLLRQLLQDSEVPHAGSWERALLPILLQCTDDVNPDVRHGDDIDIRHYVKVKRIPGGRPADTSYVSGVVFSKNLALKSMSRTISQPKIVIITFAIEFQRHQTHFMSLEPIIAQEREYLRHMVKRIVALRPQLLLVERNISGLALQYLAEAKVATVYNVKAAVLEAVSRCAQTDIISSIDMLVLKPVHVGRSAGFDLKTYVHKELPGGKKNYIYISGCPPDLGCTIVLRGADTEALAKIKRITEFMVYVVYNLKLETCLMRDEFVLIPSLAERDRLEPAKEVKKRGIADGQTRNSGTPPVGDVANMQSQASSKGEAGQTSQPDHALADVSNADVLRMTAPEKGTTSPTDPSRPGSLDADNLPEDVPMPTFYGDMVEKHQTKILSASPFVKFMQPYLLMRAREQERRLAYLKRLKDQDSIEAQTVDEKATPQEFYLITPEMVHETVKGAPRKVLEALHAVHDAEYDKALHNYETQKRQWEAYISGNINLFDPYAHQNIVVLYTVVCTATAIPCAGPDLLSLAFYDEHEGENDFDPDCTLGQYVEDLCLGVDTMCSSNGCDKRMSEHHRSYVHGEARITVFVEKTPVKLRGLQDTILMWSYCKICHKETQVMPMSENTWKYSFGKYLELSFWSSNLRLRASFCPHDLHRDHLRYFGYKNVALRVHYDPIELLEIIVPRARITWKVELDLQLKNELFTRIEDRVNRFMNSVKARISGISVDSVIPEMADTCKAEIEKFAERAKGDHESLLHDLQDNYMGSKYYEVLPLNCTVRALQEKVAEWDTIFADFDANFFPSEKDIRRLAALQLKKIFIDRDNSLSSIATLDEGTTTPLSEVDETEPSSTSGSIELTPKPTEMSAEKAHDVLAAVVEQNSATPQGTATFPEGQLPQETSPTSRNREKSDASIKEGNERAESIQPLDLALPSARAQAPANVCQEEGSRPVSPFETDDRSRGPSAQTSSPDSPDVLPVAPSDQSHAIPTTHSSFTSGIPRPGQLFRRSKTASATPSMSRTQSQPGPRRGEKRGAKAQQTLPLIANDAADGPSDVVTKPEDRSISERLGLNARKAAKKITGHSLIPRSVPEKRKETRVSALAKHFEQLSRDFERERLRERRLQAAKSRQSRATPMASSKPIVEVYRNVHEAVEEREQSDDDTTVESQARTSTEVPEASESINADGAGRTGNSQSSSGVLQSVRSATDGTKSSGDQTGPSQSTSDNEGDATEVDPSLLEDIAAPDTSEGSHSLSSMDPSIDLRLDLPKHERSSLMNMLTNFWAERSASGWAPLEYPLNATDHVFLDSDVIVREDEPSTLIAFALSSEDYRAKLQSIQQADGGTSEAKDASSHPLGHQHDFDTNEQLKVERSLLRSTGTHLKYQFQEGSAKMLCKVFYAEQFDAVRRKCGVADRIVDSLSRCVKWDSKGGKSRSVFLKTLDQRLVLKSLSPIETQAFLKFAPAYFQIMSEALFHELPTVIAKMLGFYQIIIKNPVTGIEIKWDVLVMENLFYDRAPTRIFDLKGSMRGRKIQSTGEQNEVLLDENMVEFIYESPLFVREHSKKLLRASVWNDTLFLARQNVMDYSLMIAIDDVRKELVVGIIDCIRTYTWDKKLESWIKDRGFAGGGRNRPTVTSPKEYKSRFREAMARYVLQAPNCWHQFVAQSIEKRPLRVNDGVTGKDGEKPEGERRRWFVNV